MIATDQRLTLREAAALEGVHYETIRAWANKGFRGVRLEVEPRGRQLFTSEEMLAEFHAEVKRRRQGPEQPKRQTEAEGRATRERIWAKHGV